jgi:hypothetical protein
MSKAPPLLLSDFSCSGAGCGTLTKKAPEQHFYFCAKKVGKIGGKLDKMGVGE